MPARSRHCEWGAPSRSKSYAGATVASCNTRWEGMGGRVDPRVRKPARSGSSNPFAEKEWRMVRTAMMVLVLALVTNIVAAQEVKQAEPVVVTATRLESPAAQPGVAVTVIARDGRATRRHPTVEAAVR